jgi:nitrate/TMAO reductase-like tetraheme cytochrome c subunit
MQHRNRAPWVLSLFAFGMGISATTGATPAVEATAYRDECGSCHVAYPARMLSTPEWGQVLGHLDRHYGVDASLDQESATKIARHLQAQPSRGARGATALPRITTQQWFRHEHDEVGSRVFQSPAVKSPSNCTACHLAAERGDFNEHSVRIPR